MDESTSKIPERPDHASPKSDDAKDPLIGKVFDTRYEILELLGTGAVGVVYKARDVLLQRVVALKIIHSSLLSNPEAIERFKREAAICTALSHPNISKVFSQALSEDGRLYLVMECFEGESFAALISRKSRLNLDSFFLLFAQIVDALKYAHEQGVIHRDLKPSNIIVVAEIEGKQAKLVDFGIAKWIDQNNDQNATKTAALLGSTAYMSPEQCKGEAVDCRTDIYSLGCVMFESLSGKPPFQGETSLDVMYKHLHEPLDQVVFFRELPAQIAKLIKKCLEKDVSERYQNINELKVDFASCFEKLESLNAIWPAKAINPARKRLFASLAVVVAFAFAILALVYLKDKSDGRGSDFGLSKDGNLNQGKSHQFVIPSQLPNDTNMLLGLADKCQKEHGYAQTLVLLKTWLNRNAGKNANTETRFAVYVMIAEIYCRMSDEKNALAYAEKAFAHKDINSGVGLTAEIVRMYLSKGQAKQGLPFISRVHKLYPEIPPGSEFYSVLKELEAQCYWNLHDYDHVIPLLKESIIEPSTQDPKLIPNNNQDRGFLITAYTELGKATEARKEIDELIRANGFIKKEPQLAMATAYLEVARSLSRAKASEESVKYYGLAIDSYMAAGKSAEANRIRYELVVGYTELKNYPAAKSICIQAISHSVDIAEREELNDTLTTLEQLSGDSAGALENAHKNVREEGLELEAEKGDLCSQRDKHYVKAVVKLRELLLASNKRAEAATIYKDWVSKLESRSQNNSTLAFCLTHLAQFYDYCGNYDQGMASICKAIDVLENPSVKSLCKGHGFDVSADIADDYAIKAEILTQKNMLAEAEEALNHCISYTKQFPEDFARALAFNYQIANNLSKLNRSIDSAIHMDEMYSILQKEGQEWTDTRVMYLRYYAEYKFQKKDYANATRFFADCVKGLVKLHGSDYVPLREYYCLLAKSLIAENKYADAVVELKKSVSIPEDKGKTDHWYVYSLVGLQEAYLRIKDYKSSENFGKQALKKAEEKDLQTIYSNLCAVYMFQNKSLERVAIMEEGVSRILKSKSLSEEQICTMQLDLAAVYLASNRSKDAELVQMNVIKTLSSDKESAARSILLGRAYHDLGTVKSLQGDAKAAAELFQKSVSSLEGAGPSQQLMLKSSLQGWAAACRLQHQDTEASQIETRLKNLH